MVHAVEAEGQLAPLGGEDDPLGSDQVAKVETDQALEGLGPEEVLASVELKPARAVDEIDERRLAVAPSSGDPARDPTTVICFVAGTQPLVGGSHGGDLDPVGELVREGLHPRLPQAIELLPSLRDQLRLGTLSVRLWLLGVAHRTAFGEPICLAVSRAGRAQTDSILVILSLRLGPRGTSTVTTSPRL